MLTPLPKPDCPRGYTEEQIKQIFPDAQEFAAFGHWMRGQTGGVCDGRQYDYNKKKYVPTECVGKAHGFVTYTHDVERYAAWLLNRTPTYWD